MRKTSFSSISIASDCSVINKARVMLDFSAFDEEDYEDNLLTLLSPNSKASSLLSRTKRIQKSPRKSPETPKSSDKSTVKSARKRKNWTESEDEKLLHWMTQYGTRWVKIASHIPGRTGKQVRDRYLSVLVANINKDPWTEEEDGVILGMLEEIGPQWCKISDCLQGRTDIQVKNRYYSYLKKIYSEKMGREEKNKGNNVEEVEVETEASPTVFDPVDMMISYGEDDGSLKEMLIIGEI